MDPPGGLPGSDAGQIAGRVIRFWLRPGFGMDQLVGGRTLIWLEVCPVPTRVRVAGGAIRFRLGPGFGVDQSVGGVTWIRLSVCLDPAWLRAG